MYSYNMSNMSNMSNSSYHKKEYIPANINHSNTESTTHHNTSSMTQSQSNIYMLPFISKITDLTTILIEKHEQPQEEHHDSQLDGQEEEMNEIEHYHEDICYLSMAIPMLKRQSQSQQHTSQQQSQQQQQPQKKQKQQEQQEPVVSMSIHNHMCKIKYQIEKYADLWNNAKKFTNPYEFIHTNVPGHKTSVSKFRPISRSFYKMVEITQTAKLLDRYKTGYKPVVVEPITTFHLAEGPGGFIEAISYLRGGACNCGGALWSNVRCSMSLLENGVGSGVGVGDHTPPSVIPGFKRVCLHDKYYGMTLINDDPICPGWKKSKSFLEHNPNVVIECGEDGTGNLLSLSNYTHCCSKYKNSMNIVTADGGFDFSIDFNNQEHLAVNLIIAEVFYALSIQKEGGDFILKIFDVFFKPTIDLLYLLCSCYEEVCIIKPHTSRIANSEKYVLCQRFKYADSTPLITQFTKIFEDLCKNRPVTSLLDFEHDVYFLSKLEDMNVSLGQQQIENISTTLALILNKHPDKYDTMKKSNIQKCISWCEKYGIPHNKMSHSTNIFLSSSVSSSSSSGASTHFMTTHSRKEQKEQKEQKEK
jgi:FtsJ-like methyltransferase